jgi:hypothetical protein
MCDLQLDFICTYKLLTEDSEDELGIKDMLYKIQLLQFFKLDSFDEKKINESIDKIFLNIKNESFINNILRNSPYHNILDNELIFRTLFSYDYFDLFYTCLVNYFKNKPLDKCVHELKQKLNSK